MTKIVVEIHDQTKEEFLHELLASLPYVSVLEFDSERGAANDRHREVEEDDYNPFYQDPRQPQMV